MAWRDSRKNRSRLLLFISSIVLGIAALVAVYSFRDNLEKDIDNQAKSLAGADLILDSRKMPEKEMQALLDTLGEERSTERSFASMIYFIKNQGSRLVQVRALEGKYPYYGTLETKPLNAGKDFQNGRTALVDKTLMLQYEANVGDSIKIGALNFKIEGALIEAPGQTGITSSIAPVVYIPLKYLEETGLTKIGSRIQYKYYYKFSRTSIVDQLVKKIEPQLKKADYGYETIASTKENTGRSFRDLSRFLALAGFIALLLGCIGVGSAINVYIKEKLSAIATLRCLGVKAKDAFLIFLVQIFFLGLIGAILGTALGTAVQFILPAVLKDFLPVAITIQLSWPAILQGISLGVIISVLFALPSLLSVRKISPLNALRASYEAPENAVDPLKWLVYGLIVLFIFGFTYLQMNRWTQAIAFTGSIVIAFLLLFAISRLLMWLVRKSIPSSMGYLWRQGFANLYRPQNQTLMLTVSIGLSTAFIGTLFFIQGILIKSVTLSSGKNQPNMVLFDIQSNQEAAVAKLTKDYHLPVMAQVPVVTVRIASINGKSAEDLAKADSLLNAKNGNKEKTETKGPSQSAFRNELRVTFQDTLTSAEKITEGKWEGKVAKPNDPVYVSIEENYAARLGVKIGDKITFDVQGVPISTVVGSFRAVNWNRMQTNFRIVFPTGVLEEAPQFHVLMTHVPNQQVSAKYQGAVVRTFPNVSLIDLGLILKVLDQLLSKIGFVIRFMAAFSMATGWIVLIASVLTSKNQRLKESILLRTLGASRKQILTINALEYLFLGAIASGTGLILALAGSWALAQFSFESAFSPTLLPILLLFVIITLLVTATGVFSSRKVLNRPPLEILREET
ncbi:MAG: ABC transporter permease [Bacteroidetes bacterium]|nr:ABC transporter permease [Bacteroidota bacterium]MBU1372888.1 ABC transporter permease [Bacteroidota bacterium]MBU1485617.1 ABC transporter permease [Bacteroidota bacterium]MBU1759925.1 ABC transporter permease [Bacteroidota bacterium]MBU2268908.1 ABC transporter permease [Bacteroidota bacterium]